MKSAAEFWGSVHEWYEREGTSDPMQRLDALGLADNAEELNAYGFTVLGPDRLASHGFDPNLKDAVVAVGAGRAQLARAAGDCADRAGGELFYMLLEGPRFERALFNRHLQGLAQYLVGGGCLLSSLTASLRGPGEGDALHCDNEIIPPPFPAFAQTATASLLLTESSPEHGSPVFWPGSHKFCRHPIPQEIEPTDAFMPVEAPAGALIVWHGNTWHGWRARTQAGQSATLTFHFCRPYLATREDYRARISEAALARNDPAFSRMLGLHSPYPFPPEGPDRQNLARERDRARRGP